MTVQPNTKVEELATIIFNFDRYTQYSEDPRERIRGDINEKNMRQMIQAENLTQEDKRLILEKVGNAYSQVAYKPYTIPDWPQLELFAMKVLNYEEN